MYKDLHGWADCIDRVIQIIQQTDERHIVLHEAIVGSRKLVRWNAELDRINTVWFVNNDVDPNIYSTVY